VDGPTVLIVDGPVKRLCLPTHKPCPVWDVINIVVSSKNRLNNSDSISITIHSRNSTMELTWPYEAGQSFAKKATVIIEDFGLYGQSP